LRVNYPTSALTASGTEKVCDRGLFGDLRCYDKDVYAGLENEWFSTNALEQNGHTGAWTAFLNDQPPDSWYSDGYGGNSDTDYIPLIQETRGAVWSIRPVRASIEVDGSGEITVLDQTTIEAFAEAFIDIKVNEIDCTTNCQCLSPPCRETELGGDPHFTTWRNEHFEYHGQCDMVLVKDPNFANGLGIDVHIRTKLVRYWSYIQAVTIRIGNDIIELHGSSAEYDPEVHYWFNYEFQDEVVSLAGFPVTLTNKKTKSHKTSITIDLSSISPGQKIVVKTFKEFLKVDFHEPSAQVFGNVVGMLGDFNTGKTLSRDGATVIDDFTDLGHEWQVLPADGRLFHDTSEPQYPAMCIDPEDPRGDRQRRLDESSIKEEDAEAACAGLKDPLDRKDCVYDILATQDLDMVGAF